MDKRKRRCCVENCYSEKSQSFHLFPKNVEMSNKWKNAINMKKNISEKTKYLYICGRHFSKRCFKNLNKRKKYLKDGAVPSLFLAAQAQRAFTGKIFVFSTYIVSFLIMI